MSASLGAAVERAQDPARIAEVRADFLDLHTDVLEGARGGRADLQRLVLNRGEAEIG